MPVDDAVDGSGGDADRGGVTEPVRIEQEDEMEPNPVYAAPEVQSGNAWDVLTGLFAERGVTVRWSGEPREVR